MRILPTFLLITLALGASYQGFAAQLEQSVTEETTPAEPFAQQCNGVTLNQAVEQVRRQYNGRIVSAETRRNGDCETHVIKVLTEDGKVRTVQVPGKRRG